MLPSSIHCTRAMLLSYWLPYGSYFRVLAFDERFYSGSCRLADITQNYDSSLFCISTEVKAPVSPLTCQVWKVSRMAAYQVTPYRSRPATSVLKPNTPSQFERYRA